MCRQNGDIIHNVDSYLFLKTVHDEHEALRARVVVPPQRPNLVLPADVPDVELHILVRHRLDVEADCRCERC